MARIKKDVLLATEKQRGFIVRLSMMKHEAHALGLYETGHAIDDALQKVGFEVERVITKHTKTITV